MDAANTYLGDRMLYASSYPERPLKQSPEEFRRGFFFYKLGVLDNLLAKNAAELFGIPTYDSKLYILAPYV